MSANPELQIALLIQTSTAWSRQVVAGIAEQGIEKGPFDFWIEPRGFYESLRLPPYWKGDGVICRLSDNELAEEIRKRQLPAVNISWLGEHSADIPKVVSDEVACGHMAADFFLSNGWANFGLIGSPPSLDYSDRVEGAFKERIEQAGMRVETFAQPPENRLLDLGDRYSDMIVWLNEIPKPAAILVWTTLIGHEIMKICNRMKLSVPDDVAILAVEVDPLISSLAPSPIAYVDQSPRRVGSVALNLLLDLIAGKEAPENPLLIPPRRIAELASVDTTFAEDPLVRDAVKFIREMSDRPIQVSDVASAVATSRRVLEQRFEKTLQRSPADMIRSTRLARAKHLLSESSLSINEISQITGFMHQKTFHRFFKRETGLTPSEYRSQPVRS